MTKNAPAKEDGPLAAALRKEIAASQRAGISLSSLGKASTVAVPMLSRFMAEERSLTERRQARELLRAHSDPRAFEEGCEEVTVAEGPDAFGSTQRMEVNQQRRMSRDESMDF